jgi:class 3 adenylate cyclase
MLQIYLSLQNLRTGNALEVGMKHSSGERLNATYSTVVMIDVVASSRFQKQDQQFLQWTFSKEVWELYSKILSPFDPETINTWGDGLAMSFKDPDRALDAVDALFKATKRDEHNFIEFRAAIHFDKLSIIQNPVTKKPDLIGRAIYFPARLEPVMFNGSTLVTEEAYKHLNRKKGSFSKPIRMKAAKDSFEITVRYFKDCCTSAALEEIKRIEQKISDGKDIYTKLWFELIEDIYKDDTDISHELDATKEILVYFINGGETGKSLVDALSYRYRRLKEQNRLRLKGITLATLKAEGPKQDKILKESGLLTNKRGTHKEMLVETRKRFQHLVEELSPGIKFSKIDIPWPPLGAILITDKRIYLRPSIYFEDANSFPVIGAGQKTKYYETYSKALRQTIQS